MSQDLSKLIPEFWASAFASESFDAGEYNLQNLISRKYESTIGEVGDTVNVPLIPDMDAGDWNPGDAISATAVDQKSAQIILNKSKKVTIGLNGKELSLTPYELIETYAIPMAKGLIKSVNDSIYQEALKSKYFVNGTAGITADHIVDANTVLSDNEVSMLERKFVGSPAALGALFKTDPFQLANESGDVDVIRDGMVTKRFGLDFYMNNSIAKYTPEDVAGAVDLAAGYDAGDTTMVVDGFADKDKPVKAGDMFKITGDTTFYTVTSTEVDSDGNTVKLNFFPGLDADADDNAVITVTPTESALAFNGSGLALAARPYAMLPENSGVQSTITNYRGLPVRISIWNDGNLGIKVQMDCLFGTKLVNDKRVVRIIR